MPQPPDPQETKSGFLIKNFVRGILLTVVILTAFILLEEYIQSNFEENIGALRARPALIFGVFTASEIVFGIIPPEFFMIIWILDKIELSGFVINLSILTVISYGAGVLGYVIGNNFSRTHFYKRLRVRYLAQYERQLRNFGGYLVFVGAITPIPFSATCMLAGSVNLPFKSFLIISGARLLRFVLYGWMVWSFPNWFSF